MNFDWIVEGRVGAMAMPWPEEIAELPKLGVRGVVSLSATVPPGLPADGLAHIHLPVRDFHPPTPEQIRRAIEFMDEVTRQGGAVAVHCSAGLGRTGTIVAAWLCRQGLDAVQAIGEVRRRRPGSVETSDQEAAVLRFAQSLRRSADA